MNSKPKAAIVKPTPRASLANNSKRILAIGAGVALVMAALAVMRDPSRNASTNVTAHPATESLVSEAPAQSDAPPATPVPAPVRAVSTKPVRKQHAVAENVRREPIPVAAKPAASVRVSAPVATATRETAAHAAVPEVATSGPAPITITGCLEGTVDGERFRLTDTEGANAPKARGWRSGFLKKQPAALELVDLRDKTALRKLVGHRVVTTGLLDSRELSVRSITSAGQTCD